MYSVLAIGGYRSLREVVVPLGRLTVVTGANGSGKTSLYRSLRLLADCGQGRVVASLAREGGLGSALWAGPETLGGARRGGGPVQGTRRKGPVSLRLGVAGDALGYLVDLGLPQQSGSLFDRDPQIKRESVWSGPVMRPARVAAAREQGRVRLRTDGGAWAKGPVDLPPYLSMLTEYADPQGCPEIWGVRSDLRRWRFYDGFRVDAGAPARRPQVGTRTVSLADDGADLAAALATIEEDGRASVDAFLGDAFEGSRLEIVVVDGMFDVALSQRGMLRPLRSAELSDGTLRYLLWLAALLTPSPPPLMVLNEPETSLHPSLLPALARLIAEAAGRTQVLVVTHSAALIEGLAGVFPGLGRWAGTLAAGVGGGAEATPGSIWVSEVDDEPVVTGEVAPARLIRLVRDPLGETLVAGQGLLSSPAWEWGHR